MPCIILQSPEKSPQSSNHLSSMYLNGNTQLQIRKRWVPLRSELYLFSFRSDLCQYLSIISTRCPTERTLKETVHFFKTIMLHPSRASLSNYVKLKRVSKLYHMLYNDSAGKNTMSKCQRTDGFTRKVCTLIFGHSFFFPYYNCRYHDTLSRLFLV